MFLGNFERVLSGPKKILAKLLAAHDPFNLEIHRPECPMSRKYDPKRT